MMLLTKAIRASLPTIGSIEDQGLDALARVKFFTPDAEWTWYASEFDGTDLFFGLAVGFEPEFGYFTFDLPPKKWTGLGRHSFGVSWAEIAQGRMQAAAIVEALDVVEQVASGLGTSGVDAMMHPLGLEGVKEALHGRVVEAVAFAAHGRRDAGSVKDPAIGFGGILNAADALLSVKRQSGSGRSRGVVD